MNEKSNSISEILPKPQMTLQEEIESWQKEEWASEMMKEQTERNHRMIVMRESKRKDEV